MHLDNLLSSRQTIKKFNSLKAYNFHNIETKDILRNIYNYIVET